MKKFLFDTNILYDIIKDNQSARLAQYILEYEIKVYISPIQIQEMCNKITIKANFLEIVKESAIFLSSINVLITSDEEKIFKDCVDDSISNYDINWSKILLKLSKDPYSLELDTIKKYTEERKSDWKESWEIFFRDNDSNYNEKIDSKKSIKLNNKINKSLKDYLESDSFKNQLLKNKTHNTKLSETQLTKGKDNLEFFFDAHKTIVIKYEKEGYRINNNPNDYMDLHMFTYIKLYDVYIVSNDKMFGDKYNTLAYQQNYTFNLENFYKEIAFIS